MKVEFFGSGDFFDSEYISKIATNFLSSLISFDSFDENNSSFRMLTDYIGFPFIPKFFEHNFDFLKLCSYDKDYEEEPIQELNKNELDIIDSIGSKLNIEIDDIEVDNLRRKEKEERINSIFNHLNNDELDFIMNNLSSVSQMLTVIDNKVTQSNIKCSNKVHSKKQLIDNSNTSYADKEDLNVEINDIYITIETINAHKDLLLDKITLINELLKISKKEKLIRTRKIFSIRLKLLMEKKDFKSDTVISWLNIKQQTLSDYMNGVTLPSTDNLMILSQQLDTSIDFLLGLSDVRKYKTYPALEAFTSMGFTSDAYDNLDYIKTTNIGYYTNIIMSLNFLFEEDKMITLNNISTYLIDIFLPSSNHFLIHEETLQSFFNDTIKSLEKGISIGDLHEKMNKFKNRLDTSSSDVDNVKLYNIQELLKELKLKINDFYEEKDTHPMTYFDKLYQELLVEVGEHELQWDSREFYENDIDIVDSDKSSETTKWITNRWIDEYGEVEEEEDSDVPFW